MISSSLLQKAGLLIVGGSVGTLARFALVSWVHLYLPNSFPYGILVVNLLGCLLIGLFAGFTEKGLLLNPDFRLLVITGCIGAFTTFSTFQYDSFVLLKDGFIARALINLVGSLILGLIVLWLGYTLAKNVA